MVKITSEISQMEVRLLYSDVPEALVSPLPGCSGCHCVDVSVINLLDFSLGFYIPKQSLAGG